MRLSLGDGTICLTIQSIKPCLKGTTGNTMRPICSCTTVSQSVYVSDGKVLSLLSNSRTSQSERDTTSLLALVVLKQPQSNQRNFTCAKCSCISKHQGTAAECAGQEHESGQQHQRGCRCIAPSLQHGPRDRSRFTAAHTSAKSGRHERQQQVQRQHAATAKDRKHEQQRQR